MGCCCSADIDGGKPENILQTPEIYSNKSDYFIQQIVALLTHEFHDEPHETLDILLLCHPFFGESIDLLRALRERLFIHYENYKYLTYSFEKISNIIHNEIPSYTPSEGSYKTVPKGDEYDLKSYINDNNMKNKNTQMVSTPTPIKSTSDNEAEILYVNNNELKPLEYDVEPMTPLLNEDEWIIKVQIKIQTKVFNILIEWINQYYYCDFNDNPYIVEVLNNIVVKIKQIRDEYKSKISNINNRRRRQRNNNNNNISEDTMKQYCAFLDGYITKIGNTINEKNKLYKASYAKLERDMIIIENQKTMSKAKNETYIKDNDIKYKDRGVSVITMISENENNGDSKVEEKKDDQKDNSVIKHKKELLPNNVSSKMDLYSKDKAISYAQQLSIMDYEIYCNINVREFLYNILNKSQTNKWNSLQLFIDRFQQLYQYVIVKIIGASSLELRIAMIEFYILVCEHLLKLNDLYSFMALYTALKSTPLYKLKTAWEFVGKIYKDKCDNELTMMSSSKKNFKLVRTYQHNVPHNKSCTPFIPIIFRDLVYLNDANQKKLKNENNHINFIKYSKLTEFCNDNILKYKGKSTEIDKDVKFQTKMNKDLSSYILLSNDVVSILATEAENHDLSTRDDYIAKHQQNDNPKHSRQKSWSLSRNKKHSRTQSGSVFGGLFKGKPKSNLKTLNE